MTCPVSDILLSDTISYVIVLASEKATGYDIPWPDMGAHEMLETLDWNERTKRLLKAELKRADVTHEALAARLTEMGMEETRASVANKISRGGFPASFFLATMKAIGRDLVRLDDV